MTERDTQPKMKTTMSRAERQREYKRRQRGGLDLTRRPYGTMTLESKRATSKERYDADPEPKKAAGRSWYAELTPEQKRERGRRKSLRVYGLTPEDYDALWKEQGKVCAACGATEPRGGKWHIDHCHETKQVRGILCSSCNLALGLAGESVNVLLGLLAYVQR